MTYGVYLKKLLDGMIRKRIIHYKRARYNLNVMQQTASLVVNTITIHNFAALFNCMSADWTPDLIMAPGLRTFNFVGA